MGLSGRQRLIDLFGRRSLDFERADRRNLPRFDQLKALYKERWESFLANAGVVQGFTPNDLTTADWMSRRAGQTTLLAPLVERKPVAERRAQRKHELESDRPPALSAARADGLRRRNRPALARGHGERGPVLRPALLENRAGGEASGEESVL